MITSNTKSNQCSIYPAVYVIFTLLNAIRRGIDRQNIWREFRRQGIALKPRLSFWIAVCREMGLVKVNDGLHHFDSAQYKVTSFARRWFAERKTIEEQTFNLIESWQNAPKHHKGRQFRKKLLWKLKYDKPLTRKDLGALNGLDALGLTTDGHLTKWGAICIKSEGNLSTPKPVELCVLHDHHLIASLPQHLDLLWDLEKYLRPKSPGVYPLTKRALQFYDGDPYPLIELIERGLGKPMPEQTKAVILKQPSIRIADGIVLEFSSPSELKQLRRQPIFRKYIEEFLSSQRILVSREKANDLFQMLHRRGVYTHQKDELNETRKKRTHFPYKPKAISQPVGKSVPKLTIIEKYVQLGQALDILYRAPGYPAEQRRITPLFIEERGEYTYVIAYCQTRRAQRIFRLDRIEIPGTW